MQLKPALEAMGGTVAGDGTMVTVSFPAAKLIDANGIDVSDAGLPAINLAVVERGGARAAGRQVEEEVALEEARGRRTAFRTASRRRTGRRARM